MDQTAGPPAIRSFSGEYRFLSNFYQSPIRILDISFPTAEHAYQACKTSDVTSFALVATASSPGDAKKLGQQVPLIPNWERQKYIIMGDVLRAKFEQEIKLADKLLATGNALLVEGNTWHDQTWGQCTCPTHRDIPGQNALGILLMKLRLDIRADMESVATLFERSSMGTSEAKAARERTPVERGERIADM